MAYDPLAESVRLIADGLPDRPVRLSRRHRFAPVAVDVDGDIAAARFLRRGAGCFWDETHLLVADAPGGWRRLGSGGSSHGTEDHAGTEFERARQGIAPHDVVVGGGAGALRDSDRLLPWRGRWVQTASLLAGSGIARVTVKGRELHVPYHGHLVVVWQTRRPPSVAAHDAAGRPVRAVTLPRGR
ncbi:hypothetical protein [Phytohabitans houttuyneae]|uniref:Uncharacterized protein n=1 Tax=Phytohabitans houttuyneae TaxID=1076126 RepID=A0A6V8KNM0_9ACTN|nr:hypothetical protein [Phytohabitans houttuyneae]GFJ82285.1 hypothetical protein Phou_064650 [Phytohabitans houttuyneae]